MSRKQVRGALGALAIAAVPTSYPVQAASYSEARDAFDDFSIERRLTTQILLDAAGYSLVAPTTNLSHGAYDAIKLFEAQNGFAASGLLNNRQLAALAVAAAPSLKLWRFRKVAYPGQTMTIWVPVGLGMASTEDDAGLHFRGGSDGLTLDMVSGEGRNLTQVHDDRVAACDRSPGAARRDDFSEGDGWFAFSCVGRDGTQRSELFYRAETRVTGFALAWRTGADTIGARYLVAIMSGSLRSAILGQPFPDPPAFVARKADVQPAR